MNYELKYLVENGIIDSSSIQSIYEMSRRKELLEKHPYDYWQGKNGKWYVYLPDKEKVRILKKRNTQKEIEDVIVNYQSELADNPTIKEVFDEWNDYRLDLKKIEKSSHTRIKQVFDRHYKTFGQRRIKDVSQEDFIEFLERQIPEHNVALEVLNLVNNGQARDFSHGLLILAFNPLEVLYCRICTHLFILSPYAQNQLSSRGNCKTIHFLSSGSR